ncbi:MAG: DNA primase, partial [Asticcacaulis sp.]|nr:DNA primase [Asticcacaulis sp.]
PDDVLREKGALALREALTVTKPSVEVLFTREAEAEPLDTPERKAGFKKRLRALAAQIEDKDLADSYRHDLFERFDAMFAPKGQAAPAFQPYRKGEFRKGQNFRGQAFMPTSTPEGVKAAKALATALDPIGAALAQGLLEHPDWMGDQAEGLDAYGFGDPALEPLARALVALSFRDEALDSEALSRHLHKSGLGALLSEIQKAALRSGAPFLAPDTTLANAHARWIQAFNAMSRLTALERALNSTRDSVGTEFFSRLKLERDGLRRSLRSGQIWQD